MENDLIAKLESFINSPDGKNYSKKLAKEFEKKRIEEEENKAFVKTPEFIKWLTDFIKKEDFIIDGPSFPSDLNTEEDFRNVKYLSSLFSVIDDYATSNYYYPSRCDNGLYYNVKINGEVLNIGANFAQGSMFYASLGAEEELAIDFKDIIENKPNPKLGVIQSKMYHLSSTIGELLEEYPLDMVEDTINKTISEYKKGKIKKKTMN